MQAEVFYAGEPVGTLSWTPDAYGVQVRLDCACPDSGDGLLRCYAGIGDRAMRIGLPEPQNGRLRLERRLTRETLRAAGYADTPPVQFYLAVQPEAVVPEQDSARQAGESDERTIQQPEPVLQTGDAVLDALLSGGGVQAGRDGDALILQCAFAPDQPFALAPAFVLCTVENGRAMLRWRKKDAAAGAASAI